MATSDSDSNSGTMLPGEDTGVSRQAGNRRNAARVGGDKRVIRRAKRMDRWTRWVITLGGIAIIASVIAIVVLIVSVTLPLFGAARAELLAEAALPEPLATENVALLGVELIEIDRRAGGNVLTVYALARDGTFFFLAWPDEPTEDGRAAPGRDTPAWQCVERVSVLPPNGAEGLSVLTARRSVGFQHTLTWSDGTVSLVEVTLAAEFDDVGKRLVRPAVETLATFPATEGAVPREAVAVHAETGSITCGQLLPDDRILVLRHVVAEDLFGNKETTTRQLVIEREKPGSLRTITLSADGSALYAGTAHGVLAHWTFDDELTEFRYEPFPAFRDKREITALAMVYGDVSLAVGDSRGGLTTWAGVREEGSEQRKLRLVHELRGHPRPVTDIQRSERAMSLLSLAESGVLHLDHVTSEKQLLSVSRPSGPITRAGFSSRGNAAAGLAGDRLCVWQIDNPHPEVTWGSLFGKVHYDNHDEAKFIWQSSGTHEPKFSLVPVVFGSFKATLYAMLFAVPLALFGAIYVSHFTTPAFKRVIKPVAEIMAAVPSVVVGFLVLLWLAPKFSDWIVAVFTSFFTIPATFVLFMFVWQAVRRWAWAKRVEAGYEFLVSAVFVIAPGAALAWLLASPLESAFFGGDFRQWLASSLDTPYEQLNSIVVAFGLGFAVIPIIFSISEDALSSIPHSLTAASLAVGASRWQTAWRVVLPSASPAVFAAVMIGFGRAVGETMIVFMATGNTPILDWSPLNGFRTLSANIAVEISEAPKEGTLFRVLFLCAVLLFLLTFVLNAAAELVRQRLRKKYGQY